ncbi:hypothetical protein H0H93_005632 [Arthromyces matolae]|nr:hypothetical protein H0H93_005632 [Arthromyces matolae]
MSENLPHSAQVSSHNVWVITIGINKYPNLTDLNAAVSDADGFRDWVIDWFGGDLTNTTDLRDEAATRVAIVRALDTCAEDNRIHANDILIIYFAGHGASTLASINVHTANNRLQMILPADFDRTKVGGSWTEPGHGIFDVELGSKVEYISAKRGGLRALVILDCCHSGSGTRGSAGFTVRGINLPEYVIPKDAFSSHDTYDPFCKKTRSHILLAACAEDEAAYEMDGHGLFTHELLAILSKSKVEYLTYDGLMSQLGNSPSLMAKQAPRCEGFGLNRTVFTLDTFTSFQPPIYAIQEVIRACGSFRLAGGRNHGITNGAQFTVHTDKNCTSGEVACIVAVNTLPLVTHCSFLPDTSETLSSLPHDAALYAVQTLHGHSLQLFIDRDDPHYPRWKMLIDQNVSDISIGSIHLVGPNDEADLAISADGQNVLFEVKNAKCREYGAEYLSWKAVRIDEPDDYLLGILRGAADFFRHLDLPNMSALYKEPFEVRCLELCQQESFFGPWAPKQDASNLCRDHKIYIVTNEDAEYGFEIKNNSLWSLYAAVFMFDVHNLRIVRYDLSVKEATSSSHAVRGSLPAGQTLRIGFGDSGAKPRTFTLPTGQCTDISFLKIFLCTNANDFSGFDQEPFKKNLLALSRGDGGSRRVKDFYGALVIPVIQGELSWLIEQGMPI